MSPLRIILPLLLLTALPAAARLGETRAQCDTRYGKPVAFTTRSGNPIYLKGGQEIVVGFLDDKAIFIRFSKLAPGAKESDIPLDSDKTAQLSEAEMDVLLKANAATFKWTRQPDEDGADIVWSLSDGKCRATYADRTLDIENQPAFEKWVADFNLKRAAAIPSLGDSRAAVDKRCGKPVKTDDDGDVTYVKGSFEIVITFWNDKVGRMRFQSSELEKDLFDPDKQRPAALYRDEIKAALQASAGDSEWEESEQTEDFWNRADNKAYASYDLDSYTLSVTDEDFYEYKSAKEKKEAEKALMHFGAIGMPRPACDKMLGKPVTTLADGQIAYHKAGFAILVTFWKDEAAQIVFTKIDAEAPDADAENRDSISWVERDVLLEVNGNGSKWVKSKGSDNGRTTSLRADEKVVAVHDSKEKTLTLYKTAYIGQLNKELNDKGTEALEGF
ncbi:hypothetical protein OKA04_24290 [Luteolibacter flavescens]|uniref:Uncharacterized protein n=1 Tax=Luteolibacter flavescens TaxID=1859460 RepID=A0ABT3FXY8_9BACT|nr:hypothetical protein [Luteolibacter flavescens]MCW1887875.1 hypothetical protein [Luteolibacter flavescens]